MVLFALKQGLINSDHELVPAPIRRLSAECTPRV